METALALFVRLGRVEIIPFIRQIVLPQVGLHLPIRPVEQRTHLEHTEARVLGHQIHPGTIWILDPPQGGEPDRRSQLPHAALEGLQLHGGAERLDLLLALRQRLGRTPWSAS